MGSGTSVNKGPSLGNSAGGDNERSGGPSGASESVKNPIRWLAVEWGIPLLRSIAKLHGHVRLHRQGVLDALRDRPDDAFTPNFADLWLVWKTVVERRPRTIVEYGSGASTVVMAHALSEVPKGAEQTVGRLISYESEPRWAQVTRDSIPVHLKITGLAASLDPLLIEQNLRPGALMILEGREETALLMRRCLRRKYRTRYLYVARMTLFELA